MNSSPCHPTPPFCSAFSAWAVFILPLCFATWCGGQVPLKPDNGETEQLVKDLVTESLKKEQPPKRRPLQVPPSGDVGETDALVAELVQESQAHKVERKGDPADPLYQAETFAKMLASDPDEMGLEQRWIAAEYCKQKRWDEALALVNEMAAGHGPVALAEIALAAASAGETELAATLLTKAEERAWVCSSGGQKDQLRLHAAKTWARIGKSEKAREQADLLPVAVRAELDAVTPLFQDAPMQDTAKLEALSKEGGLSPAGISRVALASAERQLKAGHREEGLKLLDLTGQFSTATLDASAHFTLAGLARLAKANREPDIAEKARQRLITAARSYSDEAEWKAGHLVEAAKLSLEFGKNDEAEALVAEAALTAPKVFMLFAPEAWIAVARGRLLLGQTQDSEAATVNALRAGLMHPHHRARGMAAVSTCLFYAREKRPIPAAVTKLLEEISTAPTTG